MANRSLRRCPLCDSPNDGSLDLGLRNYESWVSNALPGRISPMDLDFVLERKGHVLVMEFKPQGMKLSTGQKLTLRTFSRLPNVVVYIVWELEGNLAYEVGRMNKDGSTITRNTLSRRELTTLVLDWLGEANAS